MRKFIFLFVPLIIILAGCQNKTEENKGKVLAKVYDKKLFLQDIVEILPENLSTEDSLSFVQNYIDKWIKKQLKLRLAEENLPEKEKNVSEQLEDYRSSLLIYKYEQFLVKQKMNLEVSENDIQIFYQEHSKEFPLTKEVVLPVYIKFPKNLPDLYKVRKWYKSDNSDDFEELENYCIENAEEFYFDDDWIILTDLTSKIFIKSNNNEQFLKSNKYYETTDSAFHYFLNIKEYRLQGEESPLQFVRDNIKTIILNKRKLELIKRFENSMYDENIKAIEIYDTEN